MPGKNATYVGRKSSHSIFSHQVGMSQINDTQKPNGLFRILEHMTGRGGKKENSCLNGIYKTSMKLATFNSVRIQCSVWGRSP